MRARHPFFLYLGACVVGGILGALANSLALWAAGAHGLTGALGVALRPSLTWSWLRPRLLWGAIWGAGFTPVARLGRRRPLAWSLLYSLAPSAVQLFYVFPEILGKGPMGRDLGTWTPAVVLGANAVFAVTMALWVRLSVSDS